MTVTYTLGQMIDDTMRQLRGVTRDQVNMLSQSIDAPAAGTSETIYLTGDLGGCTIGSLLGNGEETMYVLDADAENVSALVIRGYDDTTPCAASANAIVLVDPPWTRSVIRDRIRDEIRSWAPQLYGYYGAQIPVVLWQRGYDLGVILNGLAAVPASASSGIAVEYPLTIVTEENDTFSILDLEDADHIATIPAGTYETDDDLQTALNSALAGGGYATAGVDAGIVTLTLTSEYAPGNGFQVGEEDGGAGAIGFTECPYTFAGGAVAVPARDIIRILMVTAPQPPYIGAPGFWFVPGSIDIEQSNPSFPFRYVAQANPQEFPSGKAIVLVGTALPTIVGNLLVVFAAPFDVDSSWTDDTDMIADVGMNPMDLDIPPMGAAARLLRMMSARRGMVNVQGASADYQDISMQSILQAAQQFEQSALARRGDAQQRLLSDFPYRSSNF